MANWGKIIGGMAGFAMGGPFGAIFGAALGHAADTGAISGSFQTSRFAFNPFGLQAAPWNPASIAALFGRRDQLFAIGVVVLSAKLAKCDSSVNRAEIDAFKRHFRIPPEAQRDIGRLFDEARDSPSGFESFADQLGEAFADNRLMLEDVLVALFAIARADAPVNNAEAAFLRRVHQGFGLDQTAWERAKDGTARPQVADGPDPYGVLGTSRAASDEELRATWKRLMRENHPDSLAARGVPPAFIASAHDKVARINAAWDRIKRERGL
jgi:DnaJ like chaperone protein